MEKIPSAIYLDNAATTWPKPPAVVRAITAYLEGFGSSPGRGGHRFALKASREIFATRELVAGFFGVPSSEKVIFTANATHAINSAVKGLLHASDHVITSAMEHNSVIRPLRKMEKEGRITLDVVGHDADGLFDIPKFISSIRPETRMVVMQHASNVNGALMPVELIGQICFDKGLLFLLDAAQTAGIVPVDMQKMHVSLLAFSGHKKLYGPSGTGVLCINGTAVPETLLEGGSGSRSESEFHPDFLPDRLEAGTPNTVGIIGLKAGLEYVIQQGPDRLLERQRKLINILLNELGGQKMLRFYSKGDGIPMVSFNAAGYDPAEIALQLDREFDIMTRAGLHCAPLAHQSLLTFPAGSLRISTGSFNTEQQMLTTAKAIKKILKSKS